MEARELAWLEDPGRPLDWNGPTSRIFSRFRDEDLDRSIIDHLQRMVRRDPDCVAVTDSETSLTYAQLWDGLSGLAQTIAAQTRPGDLVGILLPACPLFTLAMLACLAAGRPFVPLDTNYPDEWVGLVLEDARPALVIGREGVLGVVHNQPRMLHLDRLPDAAVQGWRPAELGMDEPACVLFTSGSTGRPKGVVNSQRNLLQRVAQSTNAAHINADDRLLTLASPCTIVGVRDALTALLAGGVIHLVDPERVGARKVLEIIRADAITVLFAFPALLRSVVAASEAPASDALRMVRVGGDTTLWSDVDLLRAWIAPHAAIQAIYAATEAPMMQWFVDLACRSGDARVPIGYPLPGNRLAVVDELGAATPPGQVGELIVASPYVALGQWVDGRFAAGREERCGGASGRVFRTGDLVRQRADGLLERLGRKDRQVKIRGARVELDGVESALRQHPFVRDVAALARPGDDGGVSLVAYVTARDGAPVGLLDELKALMRAAPPPMRPGRFYLVHELPRLPSSKVDMRALAALDDANVQGEQANAAAGTRAGGLEGDRIARAVALAWRAAVHAPPRNPADDFFQAGGDSLKAIGFMLDLERALGLELPLTLINEAPSFGGLCEALRQRRTSGWTPLVLLKAGNDMAPVFIIHGAGGNVVDLFALARSMSYPGPVIGIQARGLARKEPPLATVEAMAVEYLRAIKARQPEGPYHLCGYSFGGLVAFEMARRLSEAGEGVGLLGLFDTMTSPLRWPLRLWPGFAFRRTVHFVAGLIAAPDRTPAQRAGAGRFPKSAPARVLKVAASAVIAAARYRPAYYPGELKLFTPIGRDPSLPSPQSIWRAHAEVLSVVDTAGSHLTMLAAPNAEAVAAALSRCLPAA